MSFEDPILGNLEEKLTGIIPLEAFTRLNFSRIETKLLDFFRNLDDPTPTISDIFDKIGINGAIPANSLSPVISGKVVAGQVITVKYHRAKETVSSSFQKKRSAKLGDRDAYAIAQKGDIVVMDNDGRKNISTMGGLSVSCAHRYGISACIVDGGVRDISTIRKIGLPIWSKGQTPISGKFRVETVQINGPIQCSGITVNSGDLAIADDNGITFIPYDRINTVYNLVCETLDYETKLFDALNAGKSISQLSKIYPPDQW